MSILDKLGRLDRKVFKGSIGPRDGESRRDYLDRLTRGVMAYENPYLYREVIELHDRVVALEARVGALETS